VYTPAFKHRRNFLSQVKSLLSALPALEGNSEQYTQDRLCHLYRTHLWLRDCSTYGAAPDNPAGLPLPLLTAARDAWRVASRVRSQLQLDCAEELHGFLEQRQLESLVTGGGDGRGDGLAEVGQLLMQHAVTGGDEEYAIDIAVDLGGARWGGV
jgi:hypothetical protein